MTKETWLDAAVFQCSSCMHFYVDASWHAVTLESDMEYGVCHAIFNPKRELTDRALQRFTLDENGAIKEIIVAKHIQNKT